MDTETVALDREEPAEFSARLGRWSLQVLQCLESSVWFCNLIIGHIVRAPINHMFLWLQASAADDRAGSDLPPVVSLVCSQAVRIFTSFDRLLDHSIQEGPWQQAVASCGSDRGWRNQALGALLETAADYWRRIVLQTTRYPLRAVWLVGQPPDVVCATRATVCREIAEGAVEEVADGSCSLLELLRTHFGNMLRAGASAGGKVDGGLFLFMRAVRGAYFRLSSPRGMGSRRPSPERWCEMCGISEQPGTTATEATHRGYWGR